MRSALRFLAANYYIMFCGVSSSNYCTKRQRFYPLPLFFALKRAENFSLFTVSRRQTFRRYSGSIRCRAAVLRCEKLRFDQWCTLGAPDVPVGPSLLDARPKGVASKGKVGESRGAGKPWCPCPFCLRRQTAAMPGLPIGSHSRLQRRAAVSAEGLPSASGEAEKASPAAAVFRGPSTESP